MAIVKIDGRGFDCGHCGRNMTNDFFGDWGKSIRGEKTDSIPATDVCDCGRTVCRRCHKKLTKPKVRCKFITERQVDLIAECVAQVIRVPKKKIRKLKNEIRFCITDRSQFGIWMRPTAHQDKEK